MKQAEALAKLRKHQRQLRQLGVEHLYLFGSTARDRGRVDSDVDLFFDHQRGEIGLFRLIELKELVTGILGNEADVMTRASLHPLLRKRIEVSAVQVF
jgi:uncharacterized protein